MALQHCLLSLGRFFSFLILYTIGRTPWKGDKPVSRPLPTHRITQTQNERIQTSIPCVGFEPTIPVFERAKIVHTLDRAATVIGSQILEFLIDISKFRKKGNPMLDHNLVVTFKTISQVIQ
jgi:hypothetical protein